MNKLIILLVLVSILTSSCKKKICGVIQVISTETSPATGEPLYKFYLQSGEVIPSKSRGGYQVGQAFCND
ncbi:hypothetical protein [Pedobacter sp. Leaf132]|uniref:hypothetical protein n=1 Tax=Pedobacter sp. Leaf132 TaxID=2876557 RepID=UPI001E4B4F55|nr:hypothetical protein [Pedobacter sp. Leaf132]